MDTVHSDGSVVVAQPAGKSVHSDGDYFASWPVGVRFLKEILCESECPFRRSANFQRQAEESVHSDGGVHSDGVSIQTGCTGRPMIFPFYYQLPEAGTSVPKKVLSFQKTFFFQPHGSGQGT